MAPRGRPGPSFSDETAHGRSPPHPRRGVRRGSARDLLQTLDRRGVRGDRTGTLGIPTREVVQTLARHDPEPLRAEPFADSARIASQVDRILQRRRLAADQRPQRGEPAQAPQRAAWGRNWAGYPVAGRLRRGPAWLIDRVLRPFPTLCSDLYLLARKPD